MLSSIEGLTGSKFDDHLTGDAATTPSRAASVRTFSMAGLVSIWGTIRTRTIRFP
jgi:hypothetical protein